jgi:5-oxoprolinase (ATP-hydrolysing)
MTTRENWHFWIDRGGTFTDVVARDPEGVLHVRKLLSEDRRHYADAPLQAIRDLLGIAPGESIPSERVAAVKMGTTLATNALLERKGAPVGLLVTKGFRDLLDIGYQDRPDIFALEIVMPESLAQSILEIDERVLADGEVRKALDEAEVREALDTLRGQDVDSVAVLFLHSYQHPEHEQVVGRLAREMGFSQVSLSHEVTREIKAVPRGDTTMVDAYLTPVMRDYIRRIREALGEGVLLQFMQSDGGLAAANRFSGKNAVLSGPAGGVIACQHVMAQAGFSKAIGFDMGGTSTDVSRVDVAPDYIYEKRVAGVRLKAPMIHIETVAAGGGSILAFDGRRFTVGPESAGADPGPACYRKGGPPTVTDANLVLGRIQPRYFPECFGPDADEPLDAEASRRALGRIAEEVKRSTSKSMTVEEVAAGFVRIANENMAKPIKEISVARGYDVQEYALCCFGGAGPQHACAIASALGIRDILIHPRAGVLSAYGMGLANLTHDASETVLEALGEDILERLELRFRILEEKGRHILLAEGADEGAIDHMRTLGVRYVGTDDEVTVFLDDEPPDDEAMEAFAEALDNALSKLDELPQLPSNRPPAADVADVVRRFEEVHRLRYGFVKADTPLEVVKLGVFTSAPASGSESVDRSCEEDSTVSEMMATLKYEVDKEQKLEERTGGNGNSHGHPRKSERFDEWLLMHPSQVSRDDLFPKKLTGESAFDSATVWFDVLRADGIRDLQKTTTPIFHRTDLKPFNQIDGPALIMEEASTIVVDPGWALEVDGHGNLILSDPGMGPKREEVSTERDPVMLEVFNNLFMAVAEQMGEMLERVSHSVNIKERLDFSCAVFSPDGELVANAPHIPVHLGAMGETIQAVLAAKGEAMKPGDVYVTNDPYHGGSHLPDITVVTPVFDDQGARIFVVANRGHHADIGGITPGSMPPFSKSIEEEGVIIRDFLLVSEGHFRETEMEELLSSDPYPARNIPERLSDLRAQIAANEQGVDHLRLLCDKYSIEVVHAYMAHVRDNAAEAMREVIAKLPDGRHHFEDHLDSGARIVCTVTIDNDEALVDFTGTDPQLEGNLNAPPAVVTAAVLYAFRTLVARPIPLNGGCLDPITIRIPEGSVLRPAYPAAVVGGNVETSIRIVDTIFGALGVIAGSQGTMNNFTFGTDDWGYYETICGGAGAGPGFHGASAVHTHMTNTRITDPEVLEHRYPVVLREFGICEGSGGKGDWRGGDGVRRAIEFREPMTVSILAERRLTRPYALGNAEPGQPGRNLIIHDGETQEKPGHTRFDVQPGDIVVIETPGGGGANSNE